VIRQPTIFPGRFLPNYIHATALQSFSCGPGDSGFLQTATKSAAVSLPTTPNGSTSDAAVAPAAAGTPATARDATVGAGLGEEGSEGGDLRAVTSGVSGVSSAGGGGGTVVGVGGSGCGGAGPAADSPGLGGGPSTPRNGAASEW